MLPVSLSIYRGQSRAGIGEGPNVPVSHGEQYLHGTSEALRESELLQAIRPWVSLDSDPSDHQRLKERLEAWSCFPVRFRGAEWLLVARLVAAGMYDRRAAYFCHARAFPLADEAVDPGVLLGCSRLFDEPAQTGAADAAFAGLEPAGLPFLWLPSVREEAETARNLVAHLLASLEQDLPLLVAAPVREFTPGSALFALVAFARAALPRDLKARCAVRLYSRQSQRFLRQLGVTLLAVPEDSAADALAAQRDATLLDRAGRLRSGRPPEPRHLAYADVVLAGFLQEPRGLLPLSDRLRGGALGGSALGEDRRLLQLVYNLAGGLSLATGERDFDYLFTHLLRPGARGGPGIPWDSLLRPADWPLFPSATLGAFLLETPAALSPGEQELQTVVARQVAAGGDPLDAALASWWRPEDAGRRRRLLEILAVAPGLFSAAAVAARTAPLPLRHWLDLGPLHGLLQAEDAAGVLGHRGGELDGLARAAADPMNLPILVAATDAGHLPPDWGTALAATAPAAVAGAAALEILRRPRDLPRWTATAVALLERCREHPVLAPDDLGQLAALWAEADPATASSIQLRLAELLARADPAAAADPSGNLLLNRLWAQLERIADPARRAELVALALDPRRTVPREHWLVGADGRPALPWWREAAAALLGSDEILHRLSAAGLLALLAEAMPPATPELLRRGYQALLPQWRDDPETTTAALIRERAWLGWRRVLEDRLSHTERRAAGLAWLRSPIWRETAAESAEPTLEDFTQALSDLEAQGLSGTEAHALLGAASLPAWPRIIGFERRQFAAFAALATDAGALAELAEAMTRLGAGSYADALGWVCAHSKWGQTNRTAEIVRRLSDPAPGTPLTLAESRWLWDHAGHRRELAEQARIHSVLAHLDPRRPETWEAFDYPSLWSSPRLAEELAFWLADNRDAPPEFLRQLNQKVDPLRLALAPAPRIMDRDGLAGRLAEQELRNLAWLLDPARYHNLAQRALAALRDRRPDDPVWEEIGRWQDAPRGAAQRSDFVRPPLPPLSELARLNRTRDALTAQPHWGHFLEILRSHNRLLRCTIRPELRLPAFEVALSLHDGNSKQATPAFMKAVSERFPAVMEDPEWWRSLYRSAKALSSQGIGREDQLLHFIVQAANTYLTPPQCRALAEALRLDGKSDQIRELRMQQLFDRRP